jgi:YjbE family integral membrane protein
LAIFYGSAAAIVLRVILTVVAVQLLKIPLLQAVGGLLLLWIAIQLLIGEDETQSHHSNHTSLIDAVKTILIADIVMSLDNTLAIAGVAKGNWTLLITGLALSIPLIVLGSTVIMKVMDRFPVVVYVGAALIAWTAGEMIVSDKMLLSYVSSHLLEISTPPTLTILVVGFGYLKNKHSARSAKDVLETDEHIAEAML